jgi:hypothetical protein
LLEYRYASIVMSFSRTHKHSSTCSLFLVSGLDYVPRKEYATHVVPISVLLLFLVVPLIYAGLNAATVPKLDSMDTLQDMHTRRPAEEEAATNAAEATTAATG